MIVSFGGGGLGIAQKWPGGAGHLRALKKTWRIVFKFSSYYASNLAYKPPAETIKFVKAFHLPIYNVSQKTRHPTHIDKSAKL